MTDIATRAEQAKPDDLVHRLRNPHGHSQIVMRLEAADRIEALEAENERLREALELADAALRGANMNLNVVQRKVRAALAKRGGRIVFDD